jgi:hypothetical protein
MHHVWGQRWKPVGIKVRRLFTGTQARRHLEPYAGFRAVPTGASRFGGCPIGEILAMPLAEGAEGSSNVPKWIIGARK